MLLKLLLIAYIACFVTVGRLKAEDSKEGSAVGPDEIDVDQGVRGSDDEEDEESLESGDSINRIAPVPRQPPSGEGNENADDDEEYNQEEDEKINIDDDEGNRESEETGHMMKEKVSVQENSLITHPGILAAIIVGGVLVLFCLIFFFILIVCCVKKKDEGTYDLDAAMKQKLKYVTYAKADTSEKEFFA